MGGLGLLIPVIKAKALMIKNMLWELNEMNGNIDDNDSMKYLYGYKKDFISLKKAGVDLKSSKHIYDHLLEDITHKNNSVIPSRSEKKVSEY